MLICVDCTYSYEQFCGFCGFNFFCSPIFFTSKRAEAKQCRFAGRWHPNFSLCLLLCCSRCRNAVASHVTPQSVRPAGQDSRYSLYYCVCTKMLLGKEAFVLIVFPFFTKINTTKMLVLHFCFSALLTSPRLCLPSFTPCKQKRSTFSICHRHSHFSFLLLL